MTYTWQDSYPYNSISIYALHPQYTDFRQLPALKDEALKAKFEALRQELNALPQIDYERMNNAKLEYLRALYEQEGKTILKSDITVTSTALPPSRTGPTTTNCLRASARR